MTGAEPFMPKVSAFLLGFGQKCIVAAIKKWKETSDQAAAAKSQKVLNEHELAKRVLARVEQRISASIQRIRLGPQQIEQILALDTSPSLKNEMAAQFLTARISADSIVELFLKQDPALEPLHNELHSLATAWLDAMDASVGEDGNLSRILNLRAFRAMRSDIESMGDGFAKAEVRDTQSEQRAEQRHAEQMSALAEVKAALGLRTISDGGLTVPDHLKSERQRRFDRARKELLFGSVAVAEREFLGLVEDLEVASVGVDPELLLRSCINIGSCLWEQNKHPEAFRWFDKAFALNPNDWRAKRCHAIVLMERDPNGALELFRAVRKERPDEVEHICNEATHLRNSGRVAEAVELLEQRRFDDGSYLATLALAYLSAGRHSDAEQVARDAFKQAPDSEVSRSVLAYTIGFPVIQLRMRGERSGFVPTDEEHELLLEAIKLAEDAAAVLRCRGRSYPLIEVLTNLTAFYAAAGRCDLAIKTAREALTFKPDDPATLTNLWCSQMRQRAFDDAADTANKIALVGDPVEGWERRGESLILADKSQSVLDAWETVKSDPRFTDSIAALSLVARAYSARHRTADGLRFLDEALTRHPSNPRLLSERGLLMESVGKIEEARTDLANAEKAASLEDRGQVLLDHAMFLYRRRDWQGAAERFRQLGAESTQNPLFANHLICLFNQGDYQQSVTLAEVAIKKGLEFTEDYYVIAARCHHFCDNLPRAKELLDVLVAHGTSRELEHRKLLAWTYWRLDELPEAYDVLVKGLKLRKDDMDALVLLSAVCTALGKHDEALEHASRAAEAAPANVRAHVALVSAAFACPQDFKADQKHLDAHFRSLAFLQKHESGILRAIPVEPDLHSILELVKARSTRVRKLEEYYHSHKLPMGFFARQVGCSPFHLWAALLGHRKLRVRIAFGNTEEQESEVLAAQTTENISIDLFALFTLRHLKVLDLAPKIFRRIYAHSSLLDAVVEDIRDIQRHPEQGTIAYVDGKFVREQNTVEHSRQVAVFLGDIRDFLKSQSVTLTGLLPDALKNDQRQTLAEKCGISSIAPILVAKENATACYSDDAVVRAIARLDSRTPSFCTQAFLRAARGRGMLSPTEYQDAVIRLIESNYVFISEDAGVLHRAYERASGRFSPLATTIIHRVHDPQYNAQSCLPLLAEFSAHAWLNKSPDGAESREDWIAEVWRAISKARNAEALLYEFIGKLAVVCSAQPGGFAGIVNFGIVHVTELKRYREGLFAIMQEAIQTMARLASGGLPPWASPSPDWRRHGRVNLILKRQGFLGFR